MGREGVSAHRLHIGCVAQGIPQDLGSHGRQLLATSCLYIWVSRGKREGKSPVCRQSWSHALYSPRLGASPGAVGPHAQLGHLEAIGSMELLGAMPPGGFCSLVSVPLVTLKLQLPKNHQSISAARTPVSGTQDPSLLRQFAWMRVAAVWSRTVHAAACSAAPGEPAQGLQTSLWHTGSLQIQMR